MARSRSELHAELNAIPGVAAVYFQPPEGHKLVYPCIVYNRSNTSKQHAGNNPYRMTKAYELTVIDRDPDSHIFDYVDAFPMCTFDRFFARDQLNHQVFTRYF